MSDGTIIVSRYIFCHKVPCRDSEKTELILVYIYNNEFLDLFWLATVKANQLLGYVIGLTACGPQFLNS